ncbi:hypothetical protein SH1V18_21040 [Vallitalea longa]|uniref:Antitoxin SocA-like Panacea domain-containing protein n=1 Tax=Vallitalea longa TaxID=2936439 RepID=A0A9W5YAN6_9FIRM|nr:type II TA system antitoxin MqsA family protein [Vallitalea longa]GKX29624.1 hypothetical protein SH1V18_21040 [Vallitalea longa]
MKDNLVFCEECRNDVTYTITEEKMNGTLKGESYEYMGKVARCTECGKEVYVAEINDYNLKALYDVYRKRNGIIALDKVLEISEKYSIGKRPLSLLLGWGEQTFSRYCDGDIPSKQYSDILQQIYDDPNYYNEILEQNKNNLKTTTTYEKSKRKIKSILGINSVSKPKIDVAISYLLNQCEDVTPLALQKALYYIQGFYYAFYKTFLFSNDCEAWVHGPVYREIYNRYSGYHFDPIKKTEDFDVSVFSVLEKAILDSVIKNLCCYSGKVLERFTHSESPWIETRGDLSVDVPSNRIIDKKLIGSYFIAVKEKYDMLTPVDIKVYAQKMFEEM